MDALDLLDQEESQDLPVHQEKQDHKDHEENLDYQDRLGRRDHVEIVENLEPQGHQVLLDQEVCQVLEDNLELMGCQVEQVMDTRKQ